MAAQEPSALPPGSEATQILESIVQRFEEAWRTGPIPAIEAFLPAEEALRGPVLVELIHVDLECRLKNGEAARVESYLQRFPHLAGDREVVLGLLAAEFRQRRRREPDLKPGEYAGRFPHLAAELPARLMTIEPLPCRPFGAGTLTSTVHYENPSTRPGSSRIPGLPEADLPALPDYDVLGVIGKGGMGLVLKARHRVLDRLVAIKMPLARLVTEAADRERFLREARSAARLRHPNICPIHEVGQHQQRPFLVMGYIHGETLRDWAGRHGPNPRQAAEMVAALARAVGYAHERGVIHRDIKPSNVMVDAETGKPVLMDFGLAKELSEQAIQMTQSGQIMGTPAYMAPEQAAGQVHRIGRPTDVYALGVVLYELLCRRLPFAGSVGEVLKQVQTEEPPAPRTLMPRLHRDLETICLKAMARDPAGRYPTATALAEDLERFLGGEAIQARREGLAGRAWRKVRRRPAVVLGVLLGLAGLGAGAYFAVTASQTSQELTDQARRREKELNRLRRALDDGLAAPEWAGSYLDRMDGLLAQLAPLDPEEADSYKRKLAQRFAESVREDFSAQKRPSLYAKDRDRIEAALALLARRDAALAGKVRKEFEARWGEPQPVIRMSAPFIQAKKYFASELKVTPEGLTRVRPANGKLDLEQRTVVPCPGDVELRATFHPGWVKSDRIGLILNAADGHSFAFVLALASALPSGPGELPAKPVKSFAEARKLGRPIRLQILRDGLPMREQKVGAEELLAACAADGGRLRLEGRRQANQFTFEVGGRRLEFEDVFPPAKVGVFGLLWPPAVPLVRLEAWRQNRPTGAASPLERGDALFAQGNFAGAQAEYRTQANLTGNPAVRWECRYKEGCCLVRLERVGEAEPIFKEISLQAARGGQPAERRWSLRADVQLWLIYLRQKRTARAAEVLEKLHTQLTPEDSLTSLISEQDQTVILREYDRLSNMILFRRPEELIGGFEQAAKVWDIFAPRPRDLHATSGHFWARVALTKVYFLAGRLEEAQRTAEGLIREYGYVPSIVEPYCWLLCRRGETAEALRVVERANDPVLLVERCRIHIARKEWDQAAADLKAFFEQHARQPHPYHYFAGACLIQGFLEERRGHKDAALAAWKRGLFKNWKEPDSRVIAFDPLHPVLGVTSTPILSWMLSSLSNDMTDAEASDMFARLLNATQNSFAQRLQEQLRLPASVIREAWRTPRAFALARRMAYQDLTYGEWLRAAPFALAVSTLHQLAVGDPLTGEKEDLLWKLVPDLYFAWLDRKLTDADLLALGVVWKGRRKVFGVGWPSVSPRLPPQTVGPFAYVFGCRYLRLNKAAEAADFFRTALRHAPDKSPLQRLAQGELQKLPRK